MTRTAGVSSERRDVSTTTTRLLGLVPAVLVEVTGMASPAGTARESQTNDPPEHLGRFTDLF